ncbi:hypothetical protein IF1G_05303 [Cordyceps javanica]|uniref:Uncharacterized protein n=1 Tax=Cordyceps javanica TaxID=43265 RepID=A0A545W051_9HYPO|nr:hypothetical protein IF1G_05303 [Cordyceps javanica]TQW07329.1 hypothetical protein IF2G_05713 [Cordyceps javanica]
MQIKALAYALLGQSALVAAQSATATAAGTCEPHGDHYHCDPGVPQPSLLPDGSPNPKSGQIKGQPSSSQTSAAASATATGHDHDHDHDHDHGSSATTAASGSATTAAGTCAPHGDHYHCDPGVPQPSLLPDGSPNPKSGQIKGQPSTSAAASGSATKAASGSITTSVTSSASANASASASATPKTGAAGHAGPLGISILVGGSLLLGALVL